MSDINVGFGKVLRVRWLRATPERKHIFRPTVETRSALRVRDEKARDLLERRRLLRLDGLPTAAIETEIARLGYVWEDELSCTDGRFSYWRKR